MDKKDAEITMPWLLRCAWGPDLHLPTEGQGRDEMIQFYAWSFEDALKAHEEWRARYGPDIGAVHGPLFRWVGARQLKELYEIYSVSRNSDAILEALFICSMESLPIPRWCEMAFLSAYRKVKEYKAKSWDDVFGRPHPKGTHLGAKWQERQYEWQVFMRIEQIKKEEPSTPIDGALFERVGKEFAIGGKTLTEEYYYKIKKKKENQIKKFKEEQ